MKSKRVRAAVIIAAAVLLLDIAAAVLTCRIADDVIEQTEKLRSAPFDAEALEQLSEKWEKYEKILSCYIRHSEIEDIDTPVKMLRNYSDDERLFSAECGKIIIAAEHIRNAELPYIQNIL